jgi:trimeric autotransporter adhesin
MKKLFTFWLAVLLIAGLFAQSPEKMSYQAVIRNSSHQLVTNQTIGMQISILQGTISGTAMYIETHAPTTNANGLVSIEIGAGTVVSGDFETIDWTNGPYFIKTETDPTGGVVYTITGSSQLLSVPYALHAKTAETVTGSVIESDPVFTVWDKSTGISITESQISDLDHFTTADETDPVYSSSVAIGITATDTTSWNNKLDAETDGSVTNEIQVLSLSNDTIYLSNGGFVKISNSTWSINGNSSTSGTNFLGTIDNVPLLLKVNNQRAGKIEPGNNLLLGYEAGVNFSGGTYNTGIGYRALYSTNGQSGNTALGSQALENNISDRNTAVGFGTLQHNSSGQWNTAVGSGALLSNNSGSHNIAIGGVPLQDNLTGSANIAIGGGALLEHQSGNENLAVGMYSLKRNLNGNSNVSIGIESGYNNINGSGNVFIGYRAGYNETGSNKFYLSNSEVNPPLIYGDFSTRTISLGTTSPNTTVPLYVLGFNDDGGIATFQNSYDEKYITVGNVDVDQGGYLKYKASLNYTGIGVHGQLEQIVVNGLGNVGIGTISPSAKLEVAGAIKIVDGTQAASKVLTSDANGLASWQTSQSYSAGTGITISGNIISAKNEFYLGQDILGGIVFYIYIGSDGEQHGLIVSKTETTAQWQGTTSATGANQSWDGAYNMNLMTSSPAKDWIVGNFSSEWYLPSIDELSLLWHNRFHANKGLYDAGATLFPNTALYWSSMEYDAMSAHFFTFEKGYALYTSKTNTYSVRAIRAF